MHTCVLFLTCVLLWCVCVSGVYAHVCTVFTSALAGPVFTHMYL